MQNASSSGAAQSLTLTSVVVASRDQVSVDLAGEAAILHVANGTYYGLDPLGSQIWTLLQEPRQIMNIRDYILERYDVQPEQCEADLLALLHDLLRVGLIETQPAS